MPDQISGRITSIFYRGDASFVIGRLKSAQGELLQFKGALPGANVGQQWSLEGSWDMHPTYGRQLVVSTAALVPDDPLVSLTRFFERNFEAVGKKLSARIVSTLGENAIDLILEDPTVLVEKCSLSEKKADAIYTRLQEFNQGGQGALEMLKLGLSQKEINELAKSGITYARLQSDPFCPFYQVRGFGYASGKKIADALQVPGGDMRRLEAAMWAHIQDFCYRAGHTWISKPALAVKMHVSMDLVEKTIPRLIDRALISVDHDQIYPALLFESELWIARLLAVHTFEVESPDQDQLDRIISLIESKEGITYDPLQVRAIREFFDHSLMLLNGGPGTGKSTVVRGILKAILCLYPHAKVTLCAPTGRASKRMSEVSRQAASTIHSLLRWDHASDQFAKNEEEPLSCDFLIVDEFSMVDTRLFASLLRALPPRCRLLLIGDEEQLESVGPGRVFNDLIESNLIPLANLRTLFRQKQGGSIALLCDEIRHGQPLEYNDPVVFLETRDEVLKHLARIVNEAEDPDTLQVLAPKYGGEQGILAINALMQELLNPFDPNKAQLGWTVTDPQGGRHQIIYRVGDRILLKKNMIESGVFNGDIGVIEAVDLKEQRLIVDFDGRQVEFDQEGFGHISHGWCVSIHKSQGSEYQEACLVVDPGAAHMLQKRLLYTAVSRAKKKLTIIGDRSKFEYACRVANQKVRQTGLPARLKESLKAQAVASDVQTSYNS